MGSTKTVKYTKINESGEVEEHTKRIDKKTSLGIPPEYLNLGLYLSLPLLIAVFLGRWLDNKFQTKAIFTIGLLIFGTISVFYNLYRLYGGDEATHKHKR